MFIKDLNIELQYIVGQTLEGNIKNQPRPGDANKNIEQRNFSGFITTALY